MKIGWKVDLEASHICFSEIKEKVTSLGRFKVKTLLDLGGGTGWFTTRLKKVSPSTRTIVMDISFDGQRIEGCEYVRGNMLSLPFKDGVFDAVTAMAALHHVHDRMDDVLSDISRILSHDGVMLTAEPLSRNLPTNIARKLAITEKHDEYESPLEPETFLEKIKKKFDCDDVNYYFYTSYLMPHLAGRFPRGMKGTGVKLTKFLYRLDQGMLARLPGLRNNAAYICITAKKKGRGE